MKTNFSVSKALVSFFFYFSVRLKCGDRDTMAHLDNYVYDEQSVLGETC